MQRQPVSSSNIASIGYDLSVQVLEVAFNDGAVYQYANVPHAVYAGMMAAASHGSYLHSHIKGKYSYRRL